MIATERLAALGTLAAGVAHEINNPLAIIGENAGLIKDLFTFKEEYARHEHLHKMIDPVLHSVARAGKITRRLLTFARNLDAAVEPVNLEETVREVLSFLNKEAEHRGIHIQVESLSDDMPIIQSDRGKLEQIFLNIVNNAFAAVADDGHLWIELARHGADEVQIRFRDDGHGIPPEDLEHIFEPFFSTKTDQGGTGLGLSITCNLTHEIGGRMQVESEVGKGTCFTIRLPLKLEAD